MFSKKCYLLFFVSVIFFSVKSAFVDPSIGDKSYVKFRIDPSIGDKSYGSKSSALTIKPSREVFTGSRVGSSDAARAFKFRTSLMQSINACFKKYVSLFAKKFSNVLKGFENLSAGQQNKIIEDYKKQAEVIDATIKKLKADVKLKQEKHYYAWVGKKKFAAFKKALQEYSKALARKYVVENIIAEAKNKIAKTNIQNLKQSAETYQEIQKENVASESLSFHDLIYEEAALERAKVAREVCKQDCDKQCKSQAFDLSGIDSEFLEKYGYNKKEIASLKDVNDLQSFMQKEFVYHIKESQAFRKELDSEGFLTPLVNQHDACIKKGLACNKAGDVKKAMAFSDLCWRVAGSIKSVAKAMANLGDVALEAGEFATEAIGRGIQATYQVASDILSHPEEHIKSIFKGSMKGTESIVEAVGSPSREAIEKVDIVSRSLKLTESFVDICIKSVTNPSEAKQVIQGWNDDLHNFMKLIRNKEGCTEITEAAGKLGAEGVLIAGGFQLLKNLYRAAFATTCREATNKNLPLGRGSTGRTVARNLHEQLAMKEVMSNPNPLTNGANILEGKKITMSDPRWLAKDGWVKVQKIVRNVNLRGDDVNVHYVWNKLTSQVDDFKFK